MSEYGIMHPPNKGGVPSNLAKCPKAELNQAFEGETPYYGDRADGCPTVDASPERLDAIQREFASLMLAAGIKYDRGLCDNLARAFVSINSDDQTAAEVLMASGETVEDCVTQNKNSILLAQAGIDSLQAVIDGFDFSENADGSVHTIQFNGQIYNIVDNQANPQTLALVGNNLQILQDGNVIDTVNLNQFLDNTDDQVISASLNGTDLLISIEGGNSVTVPLASINTDNQGLSLAGTLLSISNGNTIDLAAFLDNTDAQVITLAANIVTLSNGTGANTQFDLTPYLDNTDDQALSANLSGTDLVISLENGGSQVIDLSSINTDDQQISLAGNILTLEDGGTADLSPYLDNTDSTFVVNPDGSISLNVDGGGTIVFPAQTFQPLPTDQTIGLVPGTTTQNADGTVTQCFTTVWLTHPTIAAGTPVTVADDVCFINPNLNLVCDEDSDSSRAKLPTDVVLQRGNVGATTFFVPNCEDAVVKHSDGKLYTTSGKHYNFDGAEDFVAPAFEPAIPDFDTAGFDVSLNYLDSNDYLTGFTNNTDCTVNLKVHINCTGWGIFANSTGRVAFYTNLLIPGIGFRRIDGSSLVNSGDYAVVGAAAYTYTISLAAGATHIPRLIHTVRYRGGTVAGDFIETTGDANYTTTAHYHAFYAGRP